MPQTPQKKRKDKAAVTDEVWTDARIRMFLDVEPVEGEDPDFHRLLKAYQSMRAEDFETFIEFFQDAGGNIQAKGKQGQTLAEFIASHRHATPYLDILQNTAN